MIGEEERGAFEVFRHKSANKRKHILSATHMKLGPAEDGGRKLASAATPNHSDGSKEFTSVFALLGVSELRMRRNKKLI